MITASAAVTSVLTRSYRAYAYVDSWRGGTLLAEGIPVVAALEEGDRTGRVPERLTLSVPRRDRGYDWAPGVDEDHPLAANGQRLHVKLGVGTVGGQVEVFARGRFLVHSTSAQGDTVSVECRGLLQLIDEARLISPFQPTGTMASTLRGLVEPALSIIVDAALADRAVPSGINMDEDRLAAVLSLLDAWGADAHVTADGYLAVGPAAQSLTPVFSLSSGTGGTVITAVGESTREGAYNAVVARGTAPDGGQVQGVAYDLTATGPKRYGGPFNPLPVPYFFQSPLLTTVQECGTAAATVLARLQRRAGRELEVTAVPNPLLQLGDVGTADGELVSIEQLALPYLPGDSTPMTLRVRVLA